MRLFLLILSSIFFNGCASSVHVTVNTLSSGLNFKKEHKFVFKRKSDDIEHEKLLRACESGASAANRRVVSECSDDCLYVDVEGQNGERRTRTSSYYDPYSKTEKIVSRAESDRRMKIKIFDSKDQTKVIYQILLDSTGSARNVISVAGEMCEAAFQIFPDEVSERELKIRVK